uniref:Uncharacterized protein n=1 Tax=Romanomermis culicivorax TaxID=13658 RepID=A0A915KWT7_ROMCU
MLTLGPNIPYCSRMILNPQPYASFVWGQYYKNKLTQGHDYSSNFHNTERMDDLNAQLVPIYQHIVEQIPENVEDNALMGFSLEHPDLRKGPVLILFRPKHALIGIHNAHQHLKHNDKSIMMIICVLLELS